MNLAIVGPGAMGCLFAARLAKGGNSITLVDYKPDRAKTISENGITIESTGEVTNQKICCSADPSAVSGADGIIFMVKAYQTRDAAELLRGCLKEGAWVLTLQNGMGNAEILSEIFGSDRVMAGTTSEGATLTGAGNVRHAGNGDTIIGELCGEKSARLELIVKTLNESGISAQVSENVSALLWKKILVNVGINPVTALLRIKNGELLERDSAMDVSASAVIEAAEAAKADGVDLGEIDPLALVKSVAAKTGENISSMHQDVAAGRRTEIDYICGHVVATGVKHGIPTPFNKALNDLVSALVSTPAQKQD